MGYRDDVEAMRLRRATRAEELVALRTRLAEVPRLIEQTRALEQEVATLDAELQARTATLLSRVRIASPCSARWNEMSGDERARHCKACDKTVYDLSALTEDAAEALLREHGERLCVRLFRRADGTVMTADCPVGSRRRKRHLRVLAALTAVSASAAAAGALIAAHHDAIVEPEVAIEVERDARNRSPRSYEVLGAVWLAPQERSALNDEGTPIGVSLPEREPERPERASASEEE